jgi:hypothetical protein
MLSFKDVGSKPVRNNRIPHVEDLMMVEGGEGLTTSIRILTQLLERSEELCLSTKWDGSPAVVCGINPDNGRFFVSTKAAFNKTVRVYHTVNEIMAGVDNPELASKLVECLRYLPELGINGVIQGDLLFTEGDRLVEDGQVSFMPNAIMYSVDAKGDTGRAILKARLGIAFHTVYEGSSMSDLSAVSVVFDPSTLAPSANVWVPRIAIRSLTEGDPNQTGIFRDILDICTVNSRKVGPFLTTMLTNTELVPFLSPYINSTVMAGMSNLSARGFGKYIESKISREVLKLKTDKARSSKSATADRLINFTEVYAKQLDGAFDLHNKLAVVKEGILRGASNLNEFSHHFVDEDGMRPTDPEGIVVSDRRTVVKLVNRSRFSAQNRKINS